jgi:D-glycero-D-manno-heptose 1,7-bisphosphate phosphatase
MLFLARLIHLVPCIRRPQLNSRCAKYLRHTPEERLIKRRALFLDRDGVINVDHGYVYRREDFEFIDGIFDLCSHAKSRGFFIFVVTNQAGIGRGYFSEQDFLSLTQWMCEEFIKHDAAIDEVYFCPYHLEGGIGRYKFDSPFRKPAPGMILQAARRYQIDLAESLLVGDKSTDMQAGVSAGVGRNILFWPSSAHASDEPIPAYATVAKLTDVIALM